MSTEPNKVTTPTDAGTEQAENALELKETEGLSQGQIVRRRFFRHVGAVGGLVTLIFVTLLSLSSVGFGPIPGWWQFSGRETGSVIDGGRPSLSMPTWLGGDGFTIGQHPFGQDEVGRDIFGLVMQGTQTSLMFMLVVTSTTVLVGVLVGSLAGYYRGRLDTILMRATDLVITMPVLVIGAVVGRLTGGLSPLVFAVALGLILWTTLARLVRGEFLALREREFVEAARVAGATDVRIIFKHILPNAVGVIIVAATLLGASAILLEAALSYLGFGITRPDISLGLLISDYQEAFSTRPWLFWWPGLFIIAIALSINFIGDGLRDAFDPRQKRIPSARKMARGTMQDRMDSSGRTTTVRPQDSHPGMGGGS